MKNRFFVFSTLLFLLNNLFSQNIVPNGSFNELHESNSYPTSIGHVQDFVAEWQNFNSSDFYYEGYLEGYYDPTGQYASMDFPYSPKPKDASALPLMKPHSGKGYFGMGSCEGAQVKLTKKTEKMTVITVSLWFSPRTKCDTKINLYLFKDKAPGNALANCSSPQIEYEYHTTITINASGADAIHKPGEWYHFETEPMFVINDEYEWFAFKGENNSGTYADQNYIYIDDIEVKMNEYCDLPCALHLVQPQVGTLQNAMCGNHALNDPNCKGFGVLIKDAVEIEFTVYNKWGLIVYEKNCFDIDGVKDTGYSDYLLEWHGDDKNGNKLQQDVYVYTIRVKGCPYEKTFASDITIFPASGTPWQKPAIVDYSVPNCCPEYKIYQNTSLSGNYRDGVDDYILAGANVTNSQSTGQVIIKNGSDISFVAGNRITLEPGFIVESGANFETHIASCNSILKSSSPIDRLNPDDVATPSEFSSIEEIIKSKSKEATKFEIFPNPNEGQFYVESSQEGTLSVIDLSGKTVLNQEVLLGTNKIDVSELDKGVYLIKMVSQSSVIISKIITQ